MAEGKNVVCASPAFASARLGTAGGRACAEGMGCREEVGGWDVIIYSQAAGFFQALLRVNVGIGELETEKEQKCFPHVGLPSS